MAAEVRQRVYAFCVVGADELRTQLAAFFKCVSECMNCRLCRAGVRLWRI